jgi:hypothetical protein
VCEWEPLLEGRIREAAVASAWEIGRRLRDWEYVNRAVDIAARQTVYPLSIRWHPLGVAQGCAGLAIVSGYLDACFPGEGWDVVAHRQVSEAAREAEQMTSVSTSLYDGLSGMALAAFLLSRGGSRYQKLLTTVDTALVPSVLSACHRAMTRPSGIGVQDFDLISGLTGVGVYLLGRTAAPGPRQALEATLRYLVWLAGEENGVPRWFTPASRMTDEMRERFPTGHLNCGLAHGIPGPLGLLALGRLEGIVVEGGDEVIDQWARWLARNRTDDDWGPNWPTAIPPPDQPAEPGLGPTHAAWCYGSPGVARSLWLAGQALEKAEYQRLALDAIEALRQRPVCERRLASPTFCHGYAGLLQIVLRFAHDTGRADFARFATSLAESILDTYEPDSLVGYRRREPGGVRVDYPGLLDGAAGVVLVLLAASTSVAPVWDRLFLLT